MTYGSLTIVHVESGSLPELHHQRVVVDLNRDWIVSKVIIVRFRLLSLQMLLTTGSETRHFNMAIKWCRRLPRGAGISTGTTQLAQPDQTMTKAIL